MKCKICQEREATKNNSHLITWSLIKEVVNQPGFKERGYDVTFSLSTVQTPKVHIGRNVSPSHIEEVLGTHLSEDAAKQNKDFFSRDHIFCPECEDGISKLENEFVEKVYKKLNNATGKSLEQDTKGNKVIRLTEFESKITYLFAYSIFFRTSIGKLNNFTLEAKLEKQICEHLLPMLETNVHKLRNNINRLQADYFKYPVVISYLETKVGKESLENMVIQHRSKMPNFLLANRLVLELYQKKGHITASTEYLFGFSQMMSAKEYIPEVSDFKMKVCILSDLKRSKLVYNALQFLAETNMHNAKMFFKLACNKMYGRSPTFAESGLFAFYYSEIVTQKIENDIKSVYMQSFARVFNINLSN